MMDDKHTQTQAPQPVQFANRLANSENFQNLFQEGMALVEETAMYLDGEGRVEAKKLERPASLAYATESMRLTTRLMQLASWLLLQRAVNEGEMSREQAGSDKNKVRLEKLSSAMGGPAWDSLPESLRSLIERSIRLQERIVHLDAMLYRQAEKAGADANDNQDNTIASQLDKLQAAFGNVR
ncbi:DUF1465 family protein [Roseibium sediminis]|uniref:protease adaptor protein RcdA n=1 Tax=Roseibium sediminis TaxID=1775174 RepID=UPI00123DF233|nr:DUF1465 family protein [Roseibium sediminis]